MIKLNDQGVKEFLFEEIKNAPTFSSRKRLEKLLYIACGKHRALKRFLKPLARDAQKAYMVGVEEGRAGEKATPFVGADEVAATFKDAEIGRSITEFIYEAYACGYAIGAAEYKNKKGS